MKSDNYVVIQGWMCNQLELKGNELLVYALIYGFCQDRESRFKGNRDYIAKTFNISLPTVDKALNSLIKKELIRKIPIIDDYGNHNEYEIIEGGNKETLPGGSKETLYKNTNNTVISNTIINKQTDKEFLGSAKKEKKQSLYDKCSAMIYDFALHEYGVYASIDVLTDRLHKYLKMLLEMKKESGETFYSNNFKGKLNELKKLPKNDWISIIDQSIENGWKSFYSLKNNSFDNVKNNKASKEYIEQQDKWREEMIKNGKQVEF